MKFKVGDRVVITDQSHTGYMEVGVVIEHNNSKYSIEQSKLATLLKMVNDNDYLIWVYTKDLVLAKLALFA